MLLQNFNAGDIVVTDFGVYQHWSLVSDALCKNGLPMLISATKRNGTVQEEPWAVVTQGKHTYIAKKESQYSVMHTLQQARSQIGKWKYSLLDNNCEHFVKWATGLKVSSTQVVAGRSGAVLGFGLVGVFAEKPQFAKLLGWGFLLAGFAILATKEPAKTSHYVTA
jgi:hypothetical protein